MLKFVKWRKKAKELIVLVTIIMLLLSSIVKATNNTVTENGTKATVYNIFGVEEIIVIEGDRPAEMEGNNSVFYSNESPRSEAFLNALRISKDELTTANPDMEDPDTVFNNINDEGFGFNTAYINFNITNGEYGTIEQFFNGIYDESGNKLVPGFMELASDNVNEMEENGYITNVKDLLSQNGITPTSSSTPVTDQEELDQLVSGATEAPEVEESESSGGILDFAGGILSGIGSVFMYIIRLIPVTIANGIGKIISTIGALITGTNVVEGLTLDKILFNEVDITSIDFFSPSQDVTVSNLRTNVSIWYVAIRNLAVIALAIVLVYIGIRMAISSVAEDKARYKKMLMNWVTGLVLLLILHYIMIIIIGINNSLVDVMKLARDTNSGGNYVNAMNEFAKASYDFNIDTITGIAYAFIYLLLSLMTLIFLLTYIKRMITIAFLIIIAPIITVTYSIDKMGDGKSQALNTWLKEFAYNTLIQVFHCIIYLALVQTSFNMLRMGAGANPGDIAGDMIGNAVLAFVMVIFMYQAEDIVKNIFNFKASSMPQTVANAAIFATAVGALGSKGKSSAGASSGGGSSRRNARLNRNQANVPGGNGAGAAGNTGGAGGAGNAGGNNAQQGAGGNNNAGGNQDNTQVGAAAANAGQNGNQGSTYNGHDARRKVLSAGAGLASALVKGSGYMVGLVAGAATGNMSAALTTSMSIGRATSNIVGNQSQKSKQRRIAKAYNNFAQMHPELDDKSRVEYSRMLLDGDIAPKNAVEREYVDALMDMNDVYERGGMSADDAGDQVEKVIKRVQNGEISEVSTASRLTGPARTRLHDMAQRRRNRRNTNTDTNTNNYNTELFRNAFGNNDQDQDNNNNS